MSPKPDPVRPDQQSVWAYPRPAIAERTTRRPRIVHRGAIAAETLNGVLTLKTSHPPTYYFSPGDVHADVLRPMGRRIFCEWKGRAVYFDVEIAGETVAAATWAYTAPTPAFVLLKDHVAFYASPFDACTVYGERATPQAGGFYE